MAPTMDWIPTSSARSHFSRKSSISGSFGTGSDNLNTRQSLRVQRARALEKDLGPIELDDLIQFSSSVHFCEEGEGHVCVEIIRLGTAEGEASVDYYTEDGSAHAGRKYVAAHGVVIFHPGERRKVIHVEILEDDVFDVTLEFQLHLSNARGAKLGKYLRSSQVMIIDDDTFPTNRFHELLKAGLASEIPYWPLLLEFFKMTLRDHDIFRAIIVSTICDQVSNLKYVWGILLTNFLVDEVLRPPDGTEQPKDIDSYVWAVVGLMLVPEPLVFFLDRQKALRRISGRVISMLQQNLLRKFLNYDEDSRQQVSPSDLTMAITRDVPDLVEEGFNSIFAIIKHAGLLLVCVALQVKALGTALWFSMLLFFGCPTLTILFLLARLKITCRLRDAAFQRQTDIVTFIQQTTSCYRLVNDYLQRPLMVKRFSHKVADNNSANLEYKIWHIASEHFTPYLTSIMCGAYVIFAYQRVVDGAPIGEFLSGVALWKGIGHCYQSIFDSVRDLQQVIAPLQNVVYYMNLPVDTSQRMLRNRRLLEESKNNTDAAFARLAIGDANTMEENEDPIHFVIDLMEIQCRDVTFSYPMTKERVTKVLDGCSFVIPQGKLVCVSGPRGGGKATLLSLLGDVIRPPNDFGELFMPPHLRVLHVGNDPEIFSDMDIFENLCFGPAVANDHSPKRVLAICRRLGMSHEILELVDHFAKAHAWASDSSERRKAQPRRMPSAEHFGTAWSVAKRRGNELMANNAGLLSSTDRCLIHLARAFIMNPDVLILHKPLSHLDEVQKRATIDLMREFVDLRGVEKPPQDRKHRCRRTCIYSTSDIKGTSDIADMVLHVAQGRVAQVDVHQLETLRKYARKLFEALDTDFDNFVNRAEFIEAVRNAPWAAELLGLSVDHNTGDEELGQMFDLLDHRSNGEVDFDELVQFLRLRLESHLPEVLKILHHLENGTESPKRLSQSSRQLSNDSIEAVGGAACAAPRHLLETVCKGFDSAIPVSSRWQIPEVAKEGAMLLSNSHALLVEPKRKPSITSCPN